MCIRDRGNPADTESVNKGILNVLVVESKDSKIKLIVYMYYIARNQKIVSY